jgi:FkbM family methyltransferase
MKLIKNTWNGFYKEHWSLWLTIIYFFKGVSRELNIGKFFFVNYYLKLCRQPLIKRVVADKKAGIAYPDISVYNTYLSYAKMSMKQLRKKYVIKGKNAGYWDINGVKIVDVGFFENMFYAFEDTFLFFAFFNDCYDKKVVDVLDRYMKEGPYGYTDGAFDVSVKSGDVVIDAGAWIGDFSAYAAVKGATAYAFEPVKSQFDIVQRTKELNNGTAPGKIIPVQKGLSDCVANMSISVNGAASSMIMLRAADFACETIALTTLDKFVEENKLTKVDFIKADIEGAERDMLRGATNVLRTFAPKLAICTYHLPDDPQVLEQIIREANPKYKVVQLRSKLVAAVV